MTSIFDLNSGSSDSDEDVDYVPTKVIESDDSVESTDDEIQPCDEPPSKKIKLKTTEIQKKDEPIVNKSTDDLWKSFLEGVPTPCDQTARKKVEATASVSSVSKIEDTDFESGEKKASDRVDSVLNKKEMLMKEKVVEESCEDVLRDRSVESKNKVFQAESTAKNDLVNRPRTGLSSILGTIASKGKKQSVQEKSIADWKSLQEGIGKELETYNKGRSIEQSVLESLAKCHKGGRVELSALEIGLANYNKARYVPLSAIEKSLADRKSGD